MSFLETTWYLYLYVVVFVLKILGALAATIVLFVQDMRNYDDATDPDEASRGLACLFFVITLVAILVYAAFLVNEGFTVKEVIRQQPERQKLNTMALHSMPSSTTPSRPAEGEAASRRDEEPSDIGYADIGGAAQQSPSRPHSSEDERPAPRPQGHSSAASRISSASEPAFAGPAAGPAAPPPPAVEPAKESTPAAPTPVRPTPVSDFMGPQSSMAEIINPEIEEEGGEDEMMLELEDDDIRPAKMKLTNFDGDEEKSSSHRDKRRKQQHADLRPQAQKRKDSSPTLHQLAFSVNVPLAPGQAADVVIEQLRQALAAKLPAGATCDIRVK